MKESSTLVTHWRPIKYEDSATPPAVTTDAGSFSSKTLITLNLQMNQIENEGVEYLADALKINRVSKSLF